MADPNAVPPPPEVMFRMITGYWVSQTVGALARLGVCDLLAAGPRHADALASEVGADPSVLFRVMCAAASVGVLRHHEDDRFSLTPIGDTLRSHVPGSMRDMAIAQTAEGHWAPWGAFTDAVKTGETQSVKILGKSVFEHYGDHQEERTAFMGAMKGLSEWVAGELVRLVDFAGVQRVVDIGGSGGTLVCAVLDAHAEIGGVAFDLPDVAEGAKGAIEARGLSGRCEVLGGDFFEAVPGGADVYILKQILHDWNDEQCVTILSNIARGLPSAGRVLVAEMVIPDDRTPTAAQLMDLNMLALLPGRERTQSEYANLFRAASLQLTSVTQTHSPFQIVEATTAS